MIRSSDRTLTVTRRLMTRIVHFREVTRNLDELRRDDQTRQVLYTFVRDARVLVR